MNFQEALHQAAWKRWKWKHLLGDYDNYIKKTLGVVPFKGIHG